MIQVSLREDIITILLEWEWTLKWEDQIIYKENMNIKGVFGEYARILVSLYTKQGFLPPSFSLRLYSSVMLYQFHSFYRYNKPIMIIYCTPLD